MAACFIIAVLGALTLGACSTELLERFDDAPLAEYPTEVIRDAILLSIAMTVFGMIGFVALQIAGFVG